MSTAVEYRPLDAVTVYAVEGRAPGMGPENVSPVVDPLMPRLIGAIEATGGVPREPGVFWYEAVPGLGGARRARLVHRRPGAARGRRATRSSTLPPIATAAVLTHHGDMPSIGRSWMALMEQIVADGYRIVGPDEGDLRRRRVGGPVGLGHRPGRARREGLTAVVSERVSSRSLARSLNDLTRRSSVRCDRDETLTSRSRKTRKSCAILAGSRKNRTNHGNSRRSLDLDRTPALD